MPSTSLDGTSFVFLTICGLSTALKDTKDVLFLSDSGAQITTVSVEIVTKLEVNPKDLPETIFNAPRMYIEMKHGERPTLERVLIRPCAKATDNNLGIINMSPQPSQNGANDAPFQSLDLNQVDTEDKHNNGVTNNAPLQPPKLDPLYVATRQSDNVVSNAPPTPPKPNTSSNNNLFTTIVTKYINHKGLFNNYNRISKYYMYRGSQNIGGKTRSNAMTT